MTTPFRAFVLQTFFCGGCCVRQPPPAPPPASDRAQLSDARYDDLEEYTIQGTFTCKVVRVYDGDSVWVAIPGIGGGGSSAAARVCCRLLHIDTPEMPKSHAEAMSDYHRRAFAARDRLIELVTDCTFDAPVGSTARHTVDASGTPLPSLSDHDMQEKVDGNRAILQDGLRLYRGKDKYGRYLAELRTRDGRDVSTILREEGHGVAYEGGARDNKN